MSEQRTVGTAILELLAAQGVDTVFGLPGVHNLAFWSSEPDSGGSAAAPGHTGQPGSLSPLTSVRSLCAAANVPALRAHASR